MTPEEIRQRRIVYAVPGMAQVPRRLAQIYKRVDEMPLYFDLYSPSGAERSPPAVVLIHGGPIPRLGARQLGVFVSYGELLAASGLAAIAFDHRFLGPGQLSTAAGDIADLIAHVHHGAPDLGIDAQRLALWAFSGGGCLLAAVLRERPRWCKHIVAYYSVMEAGQGENAAEHSAIAALGPNASEAPPLLIARAGRDDPAINATLDRFVERAIGAGATLDLLTHPDGRHGFDILDADERSRQIIRRTVEALRSSLIGE